MKICFIAPADNYHTQKWCRFFLKRNYEVHVISFQQGIIPQAKVHLIGCNVETNGPDISKLKYLLYACRIKQIVKQIEPEIISVHYASSYGTVVALSGIRNYSLSVWGSDIYEFPKKSVFHRCLLRYSLRHATQIMSTSYAMAAETRKYTSKNIEVTPFGVDMDLFSPDKRTRQAEDGEFVVGLIKSLTPTYGIDTLLKAVKIVTEKRSDIPLKVRIAGKGECEEEYKKLAKILRIELIVCWLGFISQNQAANEWANMDVCVIPSRSESFGVAAIEAQACGRAVIITDVSGLKEATSPNETSLVVPIEDENSLANAIITLYDNPDLRIQLGKKGRIFVNKKYEIDDCFSRIEECMMNIIKK